MKTITLLILLTNPAMAMMNTSDGIDILHAGTPIGLPPLYKVVAELGWIKGQNHGYFIQGYMYPKENP